MSETKCKELAEQLLILYKNLYDLSKKQQLILTGQLKSDMQNVLMERNELFAKIEELQAAFQKAEEELLSQSDKNNHYNHKMLAEIHAFRSAFQAEIERIQKSDQYLQVIVEERKRQILDSIQLISRTQNAEIQYMKSSQKKLHGHLFPDQSRFFDDRK